MRPPGSEDDSPLELDLDRSWTRGAVGHPKADSAPAPDFTTVRDRAFDPGDDGAGVFIPPAQPSPRTGRAGKSAAPAPALDTDLSFEPDAAPPPHVHPQAAPHQEPEGEGLALDLDRPPPAPAAAVPAAAAPAAAPDAGFDDFDPASLPESLDLGPFRCPRCETPQPKADSCVKCGVIFAKMKVRPPPGLPEEAPPPPAAVLSGDVPVIAGAPVAEGRPPSRARLARTPSAAALPAGVPVVAGAPARTQPPRAFLEGFGKTLAVPFLGKGIVWLPILAAVLAAAMVMPWFRLSLMLMLIFVGLVGTYFGRSAAQGAADDTTAPEFSMTLDSARALVGPGAAIVGLGLLLWGPSLYIVGSSIAAGLSAAESEAMKKEDFDDGPRQRIEDLSYEEVFKLPDGKFKQFKETDAPGLAKRSDQSWVRVEPAEGIIMYYPPGWQPGQPDPFAAKAAPSEAPSSDEDDDVFSQAFSFLWKQAKFSSSKVLLLLVFMSFAFYYWPMALTIGTTGNELAQAFNPVAVMTSAVRCGTNYLVVVAVGAVPFIFGLLVASRISVLAMLGVLLALMAYVAGVQGHLMGRLVASRRDAFPPLEI